MAVRSVTVVSLRSLSFTGTTWINAVIGSHERAFMFGPADRAVTLALDEHRAPDAEFCRVHGPDCPFWAGFLKTFRPRKNFFLQLAAYADVDVIVVNNPIWDGDAAKQMQHRRVRVRELQIHRDARAILHSYRRYTPDATAEDAVANWFCPSASAFDHYTFPSAEMVESVRYEDMARNPDELLSLAGRLTGLDYDQRSLAYWEWDHHPTAGNTGFIEQLKFQEGGARSKRHTPRLQARAEQQRQDPARATPDLDWMLSLPRDWHTALDELCPEPQETRGYSDWQPTAQDISRYLGELVAAAEIAGDPEWTLPAPVYIEQFTDAEALGARNDMLRAAFAHIPDIEDSVGADVGCWWGLTTVLLGMLGAKQVTGIEMNPNVVRWSQAVAGVIDDPRLDYRTSNEGVLPFDDASLDWVYINQVLCNAVVGTEDLLLAETMRVLRPGGHLVFADSNNPHCPDTMERLHAAWQRLEIGNGSADAPEGLLTKRRRAAFVDLLPGADGDTLDRLAAESAYFTTRQIEQAAKDWATDAVFPGSRFDPDTDRPPVHVQTDAAAGLITDPYDLRDRLLAKGAAEVAIRCAPSAAPVDDDVIAEQLTQSQSFFLFATKS